MEKRNREKERRLFTARLIQLLAARGHADKSLGELKEIIGVSRTMIHLWLHNGAVPSLFFAGILCNRFNCNYEWLLTGRGTMDSFIIENPNEAALVEQYRNITKAGRKKLLQFAFIECEQHELEPVPAKKKQLAMKLTKTKD